MAGNPQQGFPFAGPGLRGGPSGHRVITGVFVPRKKQKQSRERGTSLVFVLRTQGTWYPQGGKAL